MDNVVADQLTVLAADGTCLVRDVTFRLLPGTLTALVGPNGAGKSSLVRALAGIQPARGFIIVGGHNITDLSPIARARTLAWLPQAHPPAWPVTVHDAVAIGRFAYGGAGGGLCPTDHAAVATAMAECDISRLADRRIDTLSGGEVARVHLARCLSAETSIILVDEPVAALDPAHRLAVMDILRGRVAAGATVLVVLHDLVLAARYADRIIAMADGHIVADGTPQTVITSAFMQTVFGVVASTTLIDGQIVPIIRGTAVLAAD